MNVAILLFEDFETLDVFGPVEIFGRLKDHYRVSFYSLPGGLVTNYHGVAVLSQKLETLAETDIFLIPGGYGTRPGVDDPELISLLREISQKSRNVLTVCTGTALLAKTGLLDGRKATTNKRAFDWVVAQSDQVEWIRKARWVRDEKFYTSAGVSAGMDMVLGFLANQHGLEFARKVAFEIEYDWTEDSTEDHFSQQ